MKYTVVWKPSAEDDLAALWLAAKDRAAITAAANMLDSRLRYTPASAGESRSGSGRILLLGPLAVTFEVRERDRIVSILAVRRSGRPDHSD